MSLIPLTSASSTILKVDLNDVEYTLQTKFNYRFGYWTMDIYQQDNPVLLGLSMVIGTNMIGQFTVRFDIGGMFMVDDSTETIDATFLDLGTRVLLMTLTPNEMIEASGLLEEEEES